LINLLVNKARKLRKYTCLSVNDCYLLKIDIDVIVLLEFLSARLVKGLKKQFSKKTNVIIG